MFLSVPMYVGDDISCLSTIRIQTLLDITLSQPFNYEVSSAVHTIITTFRKDLYIDCT